MTAQLESVLGGLEIVAFDVPAEIIHGELRARLLASGTPIGGNDLFIAAHAMALGQPERLDGETRAELENTENDVFFSAASIWEIAIKARLGRADFDRRSGDA